MKINKTKLIISSLLTILPIVFGLVLWNKLPERLPYHWNAAGEVDGYAGKGMAVFFMPIFLLAIHLLCVFATKLDKANRDQNEKVFSLIYYINPVISLAVHGFVFATALGYDVDVMSIMFIILGIVFIVVGNYMPKAKQNRTIGIKITWTLSSEANWNATHRFAGKLWFAAGFIMVAAAFLPTRISLPIMLFVSLISVIIPIIYSYRFYKKGKRDSE